MGPTTARGCARCWDTGREDWCSFCPGSPMNQGRLRVCSQVPCSRRKPRDQRPLGPPVSPSLHLTCAQSRAQRYAGKAELSHASPQTLLSDGAPKHIIVCATRPKKGAGGYSPRGQRRELTAWQALHVSRPPARAGKTHAGSRHRRGADRDLVNRTKREKEKLRAGTGISAPI